MTEIELNALATSVLDCAFRVHRQLGPGLLESAYEACLAFELTRSGLPFQQQLPLPLIYEGKRLCDVGYRLDLLIAEQVIVEVKAIEAIHPVHHAQLLSYLRLSGKRLGFIINFNVAVLKDGICRKVNRL